MVNNKLNWEDNVQFILSKAYRRMWKIRKLKSLGASRELLLMSYKQQVRVFTDQNCPVWNGALRHTEISQLERVQKTFCHVVLGDDYFSYADALLELGLPTLRERRLLLCQKFALKMTSHPDFASWFLPRDRSLDRVAKSTIKAKPWTDVPARIRALYRSPLAYLVRYINDDLGPPPERLEEDEEEDEYVCWEEDEDVELVNDDDSDDEDWRPYH